jgi:hypothetical protein
MNYESNLSVPDALQQKFAVILALAFFAPLASKVNSERSGFIFQ